tara:strand:+ start:2271 stop:4247 length:1977 start_codon:yes stop_codon:yes gene_type:complete
MTLFSLVGGIGLVMMILSMIIFKVLISSSMVAPLIESFIELLSQAINSFNRRIFIIFMQFILVSNTLFYGVMWLQGKQVSASLLFSFDASLVVFGGVIYIMLKFVPHALSAILANGRNGAKSLINQIILAGFFQTLSFFGVFLSIIFIYIILFDATALLALSSGVLVVSFYYRSAGGAYKAAAENKQGHIDSERRVLTHPSELLIKTGTLIASIGGYYMDIFGSWLIAIATFFIYVKTQVDVKSLLDVIAFAEIQWVLAVICFTGISMILAIPFAFIRKNTANIFLDIGYFIIGTSFIQLLYFTAKINIYEKPYLYVAMIVALVGMLGIAFFTNYLTSSNHKPIQFICRQAQYGGANALISSFFNGLIGNAVFTLLILVILISIYNALGILGIMMIIIYALSIAVVACSIKVYSVISNQIIQIIEYENDPIQMPNTNILKKVSYTLVAIGNSFSSAAGLLSSSAILIPALSLAKNNIALFSTDAIFGAGLGVVTISIFYGVSISGTYQALVSSSKEIDRQMADIPQINEENKSHPNMSLLSDQHSLNGLKAVTLPGTWVLLSLGLIYSFISLQGFYGALIGMFVTVFIHSFFWSIFGDSVAAAYNLMRSGLYGGNNTTVFQHLYQAFLYAHYFQWVLAPTGVIIMKFVGIMALLIALT